MITYECTIHDRPKEINRSFLKYDKFFCWLFIVIFCTAFWVGIIKLFLMMID